MAFTEQERARIEASLDRFLEVERPPPHIRPKLDLGYRVEGQSVEILEIRPSYLDPEVLSKMPVAKATFVRTRNVWNVYWPTQHGGWRFYGPRPTAKTLDLFLDEVGRDPYGCFFG